MTDDNPPIRDGLVDTAVKFLQNPKVSTTSITEQQNFLKRKGLTEREIQTAYDRFQSYRNTVLTLPPPPHANQTISSYSTVFFRIRDFVSNLTIFGIALYAVYKFYQRFIAPYLYSREKRKSIEETVTALDANVKDSLDKVRQRLEDVRVDINVLNNEIEENTKRQLCDVKNELTTIKGLLLGRNQFPSVSTNPVVKPSIPDWQKIGNDLSDQDSDPERKTEDIEVCSAGSEHNTKNSDSSLEIISYSSKDSDFHRLKKDTEDELADELE